jgi:hypothetical protein
MSGPVIILFYRPEGESVRVLEDEQEHEQEQKFLNFGF